MNEAGTAGGEDQVLLGTQNVDAWLRALFFVVCPLVVALISIALFRATNDPFDIGLTQAAGAVGAALLDPAAEGYWGLLAGERRARLLWQTSVVILVVISLAAVCISLWMIWASTTGRDRRTLLLVLAGLAATMIVFMWDNDVSLEYMRKSVLEPTVGAALRASESSFSLDVFALLRRFTNSLSTLATIALVFAIVATTQLQGAPDRDAGFEQRARHLSEQVKRLHVLLYTSAAVLVAIILSMGSWLLWPVSVAGSPELETHLLDVASGIGLFWGVSFTLVLAAAYLPSALSLNTRIRKLRSLEFSTEVAPTAEQRQSAMARFGLNESIFVQVVRLTAILSPMFSGALPFLETLS